jgi:hypothetical protein
MSMAQVEDFRQHGYVVMDGLLTREAAARIKSEAARLAQKGEGGREGSGPPPPRGIMLSCTHDSQAAAGAF